MSSSSRSLYPAITMLPLSLSLARSGSSVPATARVPGSAESVCNTRAVQGEDLIGLITRQARVDAEADQVIGGKADIQRAQVVQSADEQTGADQQQQAESDLHRNQCAAKAQLSAARGRALLLERISQIGMQEAQSRRQTKQQADDQRQREGEQQDARVHA